MGKSAKLAGLLIAVLTLFFLGTLLADKQALHSNLIRLHVVANSDSVHDQNVKTVVKNAALDYLQVRMEMAHNADEAMEYLNTHLSDIAAAVSDTLSDLGEYDKISVSLGVKSFPRRDYESFSLPAGIYNALQIKIGDAEGENWWCVVFPNLCVPSGSDAFADAAVIAGIEHGLVASLAREECYEIRFFLLDCLGRLENLVFGK